MPWKYVMPCLISLVVGVYLGKTLGDDPNGSDARGSQLPPDSRHHTGSVSDSSDERRGATRLLKKDNHDGETEDDSSADVLVPLDLLDRLSVRNGKRSFSADILDANDDLVELLNITAEEQGKLKNSWHYVRQRIKKLEADNSLAKDLEDGSVEIMVPDLSNDVRALGEDFKSEVKDILGENRGKIFTGVKQCGSLFQRDPGHIVCRVKVESVGDGRWRYHMSVDSPDGKQRWVGETVPERIRHLTDAANIVPKMNPEDTEDDE